MAFKMKFKIEKDYIKVDTKRRSGDLITKVGFIVAHDTGNDGSTASGNVNYYKNSCNEMSASAHTFIDDERIIECIPATTGTPEKAWHVLYDKPLDNKLFGDDANDIAIGVELCYTYKKGSVDNKKAYEKYVWYLAYLCYKFKLDPATKIIGHNKLDPQRKTDPDNALSKYGKSTKILIQDVIAEYKECTAPPVPKTTTASGNIVYRVRKSWADVASQIGAFKNLESAKDLVNQNKGKGYEVYDDKGRVVYKA